MIIKELIQDQQPRPEFNVQPKTYQIFNEKEMLDVNWETAVIPELARQGDVSSLDRSIKECDDLIQRAEDQKAIYESYKKAISEVAVEDVVVK